MTLRDLRSEGFLIRTGSRIRLAISADSEVDPEKKLARIIFDNVRQKY